MSNWLLSATEQHTLETLLEALPEDLDLTLTTLHGLVTGVAVLPIQPNEEMWSTLALHDTHPLDNNKQANLFELLGLWHQRIDRMLQSGETFELPIDLALTSTPAGHENADPSEEDASPPSEVEEWCIGFIEAIVSAEQFDPSIAQRAEEITELSIPAAFIAGVLDGTEWDEIYDREDIVVDLIAALPDMVCDLYLALRVQVVENTEEPH